MNDPHPQEPIESLLRGLKPAAVNPELRERIAADLKLDDQWLPRQARRAPRWLVAGGWASLGAAAAVITLGFLSPTMDRRGPEVVKTTTESPSYDLVQPSMLPVALGSERPKVKVWSIENQEWVDAPLEAEPPSLSPGSSRAILPVNYQ